MRTKQIGAFFDFDETLLDSESSRLGIRYLWERRLVSLLVRTESDEEAYKVIYEYKHRPAARSTLRKALPRITARYTGPKKNLPS